ncbi:MAG: 3'(2'),5'-bisphosphate nucleotidase CysQ [Thalassococcus profundi]|uniref:3'(2'),5'-bisphosphate nucleotidase CysQ n=1 Tax=Thalassococcus profundi TaxID=2282382 RepID=UPI0040596772
MPATDLELLCDAARAAGRLALEHRSGDLNVVRKADDSPVTGADLAVDALLRNLLSAARPDYGWLSEETPDDAHRLSRRHVFIVDPIDGTRSYIAGEDTWAHSLAVAEDGEVTAAVVLLPMKDRLYAAARGRGATRNGMPLRASDAAALAGARVLATKPSLDARHWPRGVPDVRRSHRPSIAYRLGLVAEGRYDGMFTFRPSWEWDIAAGSLIAAEAGARASDGTGSALRFNNPHPQSDGIVAASPGIWQEIVARQGTDRAQRPA